MKKALSLLLSLVMVLSLCSAFGLAVSAEESVNLAAGKEVTNAENMCSDVTTMWIDADLTDGKAETTMATVTWGAGQWLGFWWNEESACNAHSNCVDGTAIPTIDLGATSSIAKARVNMYIGSNWNGVVPAESVELLVSDDGENWTSAGTTTVTPSDDANACGWVEVNAAAGTTGRYVRLSMKLAGYWLFIDEIEVWSDGTAAAPEAKELGVDIVNMYDWTETVYGGDLGTTALSAGHVVMAVSADANATVPDMIGGAWFTWWYKVLAVWDDAAKAYVVTATEPSGETGYEAWTLGEGKIAFMCNYSYSSSEVAGNAADAEVLTGIVVGDKLTINGTDWETLAASSGALSGVTLGVNVPAEGGNGGTVVITKGDNVALNKTYTLSGCGERSAYYAKLTDGAAKDAISYDSNEWFGFYCNGDDLSVINAPDKVGYVVIDLGKETDLHSVRLNTVNNTGSGIPAPEYFKAYISDDGENWTEAADLAVQSVEDTAYWTEASLSGSARYVKVEVKLSGTFAFINEIEVYEAVKTIVNDGPQVIVEEITVDGDLTDTGWNNKGWTKVSGKNGSWQYPTLKEVAEGAEIPTFTYKYQLRADDTKLYGALVLDGVHEEVDGEAKNIKVRIWIRDNDEATVYSSFYDFVLAPDGTLTTAAKYNTSTTENKGANIENTTLNAVAKVVNGKTVYEFSVDVAEVTKDGSFDYYVSLERKQGVNTGTLYYPAIPELSETAPHGNHPWMAWYAENDATVNVSDILLGEVIVSDEEEPDTSLMGTAPSDPAYKTTLSVENGWEKGKDLKVKVTIEALKDVNLAQVIFNLFYDANDVAPVLPEEPELGTLVTSGADSWKDSSIFYLGEAEEGYGLLIGAPGTTNKDDALNAGDKIEITLTFKVLDTASGLINFQLSNDELLGYSYETPEVADVVGEGASLAVAVEVQAGDAGIYVIAALALVALIGAAVIIKKRA